MVAGDESLLTELVAGTAEDVWRFAGTVGSERALTYAQGWVRSDEPGVREVGFVVLGSAALNHPPALTVLLDLAPAGCADADVDVRAAVAQALGNQSAEQRCVPLLLGLLDDVDADVRRIAIAGLPITLDDPPVDHPAITALVEKLSDTDPEVRDWAAFAIGTQLDVDSPLIRSRLRGLLDEPETGEACAAAEAAVGLARRGDRGVLSAVIDRLMGPNPGALWLVAAAELADPCLLPALDQLRAPDNQPDDPWVEQLERAIASCRNAM